MAPTDTQGFEGIAAIQQVLFMIIEMCDAAVLPLFSRTGLCVSQQVCTHVITGTFLGSLLKEASCWGARLRRASRHMCIPSDSRRFSSCRSQMSGECCPDLKSANTHHCKRLNAGLTTLLTAAASTMSTSSWWYPY